MKILKSSPILIFILLFLGCRNDLDRQLYKIEHDNSSNITSPTFVKDSGLGEEAPSEAELDPIALKYFKNFKAAMYATAKIKKTTLISNSLTYESNNPFMFDLKDVDIEDDNGNKLSFFDLNKQEQDTFLDRWVRFQAKNLGDKIQICPELEKEINFENQALEKTLTSNISSLSQFLLEYKNTLNNILENNSPNQINIWPFFKKYIDSVSVIKTLSILTQYAVRGNLLVRLAKDGHPWTLLNLDNGSVGHVGIIFRKVPATSKKDYEISIAAQKRGPTGKRVNKIVKEQIDEWARTCYILEILEIKHHKNGKLKSIHPVSNQSAIADLAENYIGVRYVEDWQFPIANIFAPGKFTCSSLAWWCAKKTYKINFSSNYFYQIGSKISISPEAIFRNNHTRIKAKIVDYNENN